MFESSQAKNRLAALLLVGTIAGLMFVTGSAAALVDSNILLNDTVEIDNETDTVYADVTNTTNGSVNVTFYGYNETTGNYTLESEQQVESPDNTTRVDWVADLEAFDSYEIYVHEDDSNTDTQDVESVAFGSTTIGGGGGFFSGGESSQNVLVLVVVVGLLGYLAKGRD